MRKNVLDRMETLKTQLPINKVNISFRNEMSNKIPSSTYGGFGIYKYPAKFIPHIVAYVLDKYSKKGMTVLDPFAGYGTVGSVSRIYGVNYELWDLNPLLSVIHNTYIKKSTPITARRIFENICHSRNEHNFVPQWDKLYYWFQEEFVSLLSSVWGYVHRMDSTKQHIVQIPLIKLTRYFSNSDEKVHKLYISKNSKIKIRNLKNTNWKNLFFSMLEREIFILQNRLKENQNLRPVEVKYKIKSGCDVLGLSPDNDVDILITSPPYLQAQEYIRSTKLELFWLGFDNNYIKELSQKEIPYRNSPDVSISSDLFFFYRSLINEKHLMKIYDNYFNSVIKILSDISVRVNKYMFIFVGPAKIREMKIPIDEIIAEHFVNSGWKHRLTYIDKIVSRSLFKSKKNPASGLKDERMEHEYLLVLER
ncbi:MAG: hypothetical protein N2510_06120 [Ignavibacteria bacterium]|nr:hypothetical protein [Ignavibacteria bacterium]